MFSKKVLKVEETIALLEQDLFKFMQFVNPNYLYGRVHEEVAHWLSRSYVEDEAYYRLILLPRGHLKSHIIACYAAWEIIRNPAISIMYVSATAERAENQLYAIKNILSSDRVASLWPELLYRDEGKREKWAVGAISVDHPLRKVEGTRDHTVTAAGLTTNTTGSHADLVLADDVVVPNNAYTEEGRSTVSKAMSQMASILNTGGKIVAVGTRYHPKDQYHILKGQKVPKYCEETDEIIDETPLWEVKEEVVEREGTFLWPRKARSDGKSYGFNRRELSRIKATYTDQTQYYAQYYNNPNDPDNEQIPRKYFQYYDKKHLSHTDGYWYFKNNRLNVYAAIDFAFSIRKKADYTAIVVIGVDGEGNYYILDIERLKSSDISDYFKAIQKLHMKWLFPKIRAEVTIAQQAIVREIREVYIKKAGLKLAVDEYRPTRHEGSKVERLQAILQPKYESLAVWHYKGGNCFALEEELVMQHPPHDDIKDALAAAIDVAVAPSRHRSGASKQWNTLTGRIGNAQSTMVYNSRFGGVT